MEEAGAKKKKEPRPNEQGMSLCGVSPPPFSAPSFPSPPPLPLPREGEDWSGETGYTGRINERGDGKKKNKDAEHFDFFCLSEMGVFFSFCT